MMNADLTNSDTIIAIATPAGEGALSVIRLSGPEAIASVEPFFDGNVKLTKCAGYTIHYGKFIGGNGEMIDDVLISVFRAPHSYTGEDALEMSTHGSPLITEKIISTMTGAGVRLAQPGEFTRRAYLNGRIDLVQAEAVCDLIHSRTEASMRGARNQLNGLLSGKVKELRARLIDIFSMLELELDFAEEDLEFVDKTELLGKFDQLIDEITMLIDSFAYGRIVRDGVNVAIVGPPNAGKSSLLNYLLKESRAIVSAIPGTTRDIIREEVSIDGILYRLFDTAGIRKSTDEIEREGLERTDQSIKDADLVLFMNDASKGLAEDIADKLKNLVRPGRVITVFNKIDLDHQPIDEADARISIKEGTGINDLFALFKEKALGTQNYSEKSAIVTNARHHQSLQRACASLKRAKDACADHQSGEFVAADMRQAEESLSEIIGKATADDVLNNIFAKFCIGK